MLCFTMHTMTYADEKRAKYEELVRRDEEIQAFLGTFNETREQGVWVCGYIYVCRGVCVCVCLCVGGCRCRDCVQKIIFMGREVG